MRDELVRQYRMLRGEFAVRMVFVALGYGVCALYVNPAIMLALFMVEFGGELVSQRLLRRLDPAKSPARYRAFLLSIIPMEASLITAAGLVWLQDDPYAKSIAIGIVMGSLLHLTSVRSIHLALGVIGMATVAVVVLTFNILHWVSLGNWTGLTISTGTALVAF
ncbi:MAG: hypothetical protein WAS32_07750, partial [Tabrizicola sp.]